MYYTELVLLYTCLLLYFTEYPKILSHCLVLLDKQSCLYLAECLFGICRSWRTRQSHSQGRAGEQGKSKIRENKIQWHILYQKGEVLSCYSYCVCHDQGTPPCNLKRAGRGRKVENFPESSLLCAKLSGRQKSEYVQIKP